MHSLAHYALLGSLIAGAAGALVLAVITFRHGILRRRETEDDLSADDAARRLRTIRVADTVAVLCFAVAAGLGAIGLTTNMRATSPAVASAGDTSLSARVSVLEGRLGTAEQQLKAQPEIPDLRAWEERLARIESRLGAVEDRAAVADRRATEADRRAADADRRAVEADRRATAADRRAGESDRRAVDADRRTGDAEQVTRREGRARPTTSTPASKRAPAPVVTNPVHAPSLPPSASPRLNPPGPAISVRPPEAARPAVEVPKPDAAATSTAPEQPVPPVAGSAAPATVATVPPPPLPRESSRASVAPPAREPMRAEPPTRESQRVRTEVVAREPVRVRSEPAAGEMSFGEKLRHDWTAIREHAARGGDEWRDGWRQLKSLFGQ